MKMNNLQTSLTGQLSALDSKINALDFKIGALQSNFERGILTLKTELAEHESRLVWGFIFAASVLIFPIFSLLII